MRDDGYGRVDDCRSGQQPEAEEAPRGVEDVFDRDAEEAAHGTEGRQQAIDPVRKRQIAEACALIDQATPEELAEAYPVDFLVSERREVLYSGMLPHPSCFAAYPSEVQERICRWNDAYTTDESKRQDRLVDNEIRQQRMASVMTFVLVLLFCLLSFLAFVITRDASSFWLLSVPVANVLGNLIRPAFSKSSRA